jgi:saxitoxin biosynthesis operon SxtJ-like protein
MTLVQDIRKLKTGPRELRNFGLMVGGVFVAIGLLLLLRHKPSYPFFLCPGVALVVFGAVAPRVLKYLYIAWMSVALTLGFILSYVILTLLFFVLVTPIALLARLLGKDFLARKLDKQATTYWIRCETEAKAPANYERQF